MKSLTEEGSFFREQEEENPRGLLATVFITKYYIFKHNRPGINTPEDKPWENHLLEGSQKIISRPNFTKCLSFAKDPTLLS